MSTKASPAFASSPSHPPVGTYIDNGSLELVEVLGVGGYGVVYRAIDARHSSGPKSYAVKCLIASGHQSSRQRHVHIREITLHKLASAHPGVVTLHRVVEHLNHTYIIMDYAPDHDLFTQILHSCRYLGDDGLIKDVFLQLLEAVEYCHEMGIYHRDLKPENILCYDDGLRVAITDFGLATTDKLSDEFRTGSVYHMSPECQGGEFAPTRNYSPKANDVWSLGIILLNLATGRNPWKSATPSDPTFQAYLRDPHSFMPSVLPISPEVNDILVRMLDVNWRTRANIRDVRYAIEEITSFYSDGVVFEGSMARCPWESGMDIDSASDGTDGEGAPESPPATSTYDDHHHYHHHSHSAKPDLDLDVGGDEEDENVLASHWSKDSISDIIFATTRSLAQESSYGGPWTAHSSSGATWAFESPISSDSDDHVRVDHLMSSGTESSGPSSPTTPNSLDVTFHTRAHPRGGAPKSALRSTLMINTNIPQPRIYDHEHDHDFGYAATNMATSQSARTSMMHTAIEYDPYSSMFFLNSPVSPGKGLIVMPDSTTMGLGQVLGDDKAMDMDMISATVWTSSSATEMSRSSYSDSNSNYSSSDSFEYDDGQQEDIQYSRAGTPAALPDLDLDLEPHGWTPFVRSHPFQYQHGKVECSSPQQSQSQLSPSLSSNAITNIFPDCYSRLSPAPVPSSAPSDAKKKRHDSTPNPLTYTRNFFSPTTPTPPTLATRPNTPSSRPSSPSKLPQTLTRLATKLFSRPPSPAPPPSPPPPTPFVAFQTPSTTATTAAPVARGEGQGDAEPFPLHAFPHQEAAVAFGGQQQQKQQQQQLQRTTRTWFLGRGRFRASTLVGIRMD